MLQGRTIAAMLIEVARHKRGSWPSLDHDEDHDHGDDCVFDHGYDYVLDHHHDYSGSVNVKPTYCAEIQR